MSDPDLDLKATLAAMADEELAREGHPSPDELAAYRGRALSATGEDRIQEHLAACPDCAALLFDLDLFRSPAADHERPSQAQVDAVWQSVRTRAGRQGGTADGSLRPPRPRERSRIPVWMRTAAAALAVAVVGLSVWVATLKRALDEASRPQVNAPVLDVYAAPPRGEGAPAAEVRLPPGTGAFVLVLNPDGALRHDEYAAEIVRGDGTLVWSGRGLRRNAYDTFSLTLSARRFPAGDYRLRLFGLDGPGGAREPAGELAFRVAPEGS